MAYMMFIALVFLNQKHLVVEEPIRYVNEGMEKAKYLWDCIFHYFSSIHILLLFNPMSFFCPLPWQCILFACLGLPVFAYGQGVSNGAIISILSV
jgi:hypothetical protein